MKKHLLTLLILTVALTMSAVERPVAKMRQAAAQTLNASKAKVTLSKPTLEVYHDGSRFAIVSRDDRFPEVLAYGTGNFDLEKAPENVKWWFDAVQHSMEKTIKANAPRRVSAVYDPVAPLMTTKWGQATPYNDMCPRESGNEQNQDSPRCPSGCVATAMAQILNYNQYPASVQFTGYCYLNNSEEKYEEKEIQSTYSWPYLIAYGYYLPDGYSSMDDVKSQSYNVLQGNSIATLLRDCGYAIGISYTQEGSGGVTIEAASAFTDVFNYPQQCIKYWERSYYSDQEWLEMLHQEFANGSPVLYSGVGETSGGHAFVLHGMDADGLCYVNWGWDGLYDGYFAIDVLNPGDYDFSNEQDLIAGIRPSALPTDVTQSLFVTGTPFKFAYDNSTTELTFTLTSDLYNNTLYDFSGSLCVVLEDMSNSEGTEYIDFLNDDEVVSSYYGYSAFSTSLGPSTFASGTYRFYLASKATGETSWQYVRTQGGAFYYEITVDAHNKVSVADTPTFTTGNPNLPTALREIKKETIVSPTASERARFFDLQGREVNANTKGMIILRQGSEVKKVMAK